MIYKSTEKQRAYWREYHATKQALKPPKILKSRYRFIRGENNQGKLVHQDIVEKVLCKKLPYGAEIHHVDGNGHNNSHDNLVVCPDHAYHALLHLRSRALAACGNPSWMICRICKKWDAKENLSLDYPKDQTTPRAVHVECRCAYNRMRYARNKHGLQKQD